MIPHLPSSFQLAAISIFHSAYKTLVSTVSAIATTIVVATIVAMDYPSNSLQIWVGSCPRC